MHAKDKKEVDCSIFNRNLSFYNNVNLSKFKLMFQNELVVIYGK